MMIQTDNQTFSNWLAAIVLFCLALLLLAVQPKAQAATATISCPDLDNINTCQVDTNDSFGFGYLVDLLGNVNSCRLNDNESSAMCDAGNLGQFECIASGNSFNCELPDTSQLNCQYNDEANTASCTLNTDSAIANYQAISQSINLSQPQSETFTAIVNTCTSHSGSNDFQRDCDALLAAARTGEAGFLNALEQITPHTFAAAFDSLNSALDAQNHNLSMRLFALRHHVEKVKAAKTAEKAARYYPLNSLPLLGSRGGNAGDPINLDEKLNDATIQETRLSTYLLSTNLDGNKEDSIQEIGSDWRSSALSAGGDYRLNNSTTIGVAFGFTSTDSELNQSRGSIDNQSYNITSYGQYVFKNNIYLNATFTYAGSDIEQERSIIYNLPGSTVDQVASARYFGTQTESTLETGFELIHAQWNLTSYAQLALRETDIDAYSEALSDSNGNGSGWSFSVDKQRVNSLLLSAGSQISYASSHSWGVLMPTARVEYKQELKDDPRLIRAQFRDDFLLQQSIGLEQNEVDTQYLEFGLGLAATFTSGHFGYIYWQTTESLDYIDQQLLNLGWRWEF